MRFVANDETNAFKQTKKNQNFGIFVFTMRLIASKSKRFLV